MLATEQVIAAVKDRLVAGPTAAGARVYTDRDYPLGTEQLPAWLVHMVDEEITPETMHWPPEQRHVLTIAARACVSAAPGTGVDAALHAMRLQALQCLFDTLDHAMLGVLKVPLRQRRATPDLSAGLDTKKGELTLLLEAEFHTLADAPEAFA